jgi:hypothetical protein
MHPWRAAPHVHSRELASEQRPSGAEIRTTAFWASTRAARTPVSRGVSLGADPSYPLIARVAPTSAATGKRMSGGHPSGERPGDRVVAEGLAWLRRECAIPFVAKLASTHESQGLGGRIPFGVGSFGMVRVTAS